MVTAREVRRILDDRPELELGLEKLRAADEPFEFHDLDMDSGTFGELVATPLVEEAESGQGYVLADRTATAKALDGEVNEDGSESADLSNLPLPSLDRRRLGFLSGALLLVVLMRVVFSVSNVFYRGRVVLSANDPYYYRYWVEQLLSNPDLTLGTFPRTLELGEPLYVASMWFFSNLFGGSDAIVGWVLAWYPVISALITALLLYVLALQITEDRRIALGAVLLFAILPGHAMRTSLGFADHHAFDYPWLALTAVSLVSLVRTAATRRQKLAGVVGLAFGVSGQTLAWEAGPLLIAPIGLIVAVLAVLWVFQHESPARNGVPILVGLGVASALTWTVHSSLGWHSALVAVSPLLLTVGAVGVLAVAEVINRLYLSASVAAIAELLVGGLGFLVFRSAFPEFWATTVTRVTQTLLRTDAIAETKTLFGDSAAWLLLFGFILVLALPYLVWATWEQRRDLRWAVPVGYGWALFVLSIIQIRFVGEFGFVAAFFAGVGLVHLTNWVDLSRPPKPFKKAISGSKIRLPDRRQFATLIVLFLMVGSLSILGVPVKTSQVTTSQERADTAFGIANYSETQNLSYPENRVFSAWGDARMYNYFVNGESHSYGFSRANFEAFLSANDSAEWRNRLQGRVGFIVTNTVDSTETVPQETNYVKFHRNNATSVPGYEMVYASDSGQFKVFRIVDEG